MKICVVTSSFPTHVGDTLRAPFLLEAITALRAQGHEIHVLTQGPGERSGFDFPVTAFYWPGQKDESAAGLLARPIQNSWRILSLLLSGTLALARAHRRERFDVVFCCWAVPSGFYARAARLMSGPLPYTVWCLGSDVNSLKGKKYGRAILRWILRPARARFADGLRLAADVKAISEIDCEFIPTFRTLAGLSTSATAARAGNEHLTYIGRHDLVKGVDLLLEAFAQVASDYPRARLSLAGDGPLNADLRRRVRELGLENRIAFLGRVPDAELAAVYGRADIVVIPSRSESIPLVLGEAIQAGRPVVVTKVGDMGTLVEKYALGLTVERPDAALLAQALRKALAAPIRLDQSQCQAFLDLLSFQKQVPRLISLLGGVP